MNYLWEGLNPVYLLPSILLVVYLHIIGLVANKKIGTTIPTVLMGFLSSLIVSAPFLIPAHLGIIDYSKVIFLIPNISLIIFSVIVIIIEGVKITLNRKVIITSLSFYFISLVYFNIKPGTLHDYWLYGEWISYGSGFDYSSVESNSSYIYGLTIMYTWMGSYIGLVLGGTTQVAVGEIHIEWQVVASVLWIFINTQVLYRVVKKIKFSILLPCLVIATLFMVRQPLFGYGFYGSFSLHWIFLIILTTKEHIFKNTIILSVGFIFMASTTLVVAPLIIMTAILVRQNKILIPRRMLDRTYLITPASMLIIIIINLRGYSYFDFNTWVVEVLKHTIAIISASIILSYSNYKFKQIIIVNSILALLANLTFNYNWNLLILDIMPRGVMHRYLGFMLGHSLSPTLITIITLPWAMHLLYEHYKAKKI